MTVGSGDDASALTDPGDVAVECCEFSARRMSSMQPKWFRKYGVMDGGPHGLGRLGPRVGRISKKNKSEPAESRGFGVVSVYTTKVRNSTPLTGTRVLNPQFRLLHIFWCVFMKKHTSPRASAADLAQTMVTTELIAQSTPQVLMLSYPTSGVP